MVERAARWIELQGARRRIEARGNQLWLERYERGDPVKQLPRSLFLGQCELRGGGSGRAVQKRGERQSQAGARVVVVHQLEAIAAALRHNSDTAAVGPREQTLQRIPSGGGEQPARRLPQVRHSRCICRNVSDADHVMRENPVNASAMVSMRSPALGTMSPNPSVVYTTAE